ncbi:prepilin-type N-terminal cleavage/methylation domain-containing protein [Deefgea sp. CFH1-16]|uniref:type IV pilus modification PilV family protein n=1 Tax=Deefgea sp. CFH1-16 TaxID=2675457 RepID=UPI001940229A
MPVNSLSSPRPQAGFSLIEVLIGIVVLSVGLLGFWRRYNWPRSSTTKVRPSAIWR